MENSKSTGMVALDNNVWFVVSADGITTLTAHAEVGC